MEHINKMRREHPSLAIPPSDTLQTQHVMTGLDELLQEDPGAMVVTGVGQHQMWAAQFLSFNQANTFVSSGGQGAMGFEVPAALGMQAARPDATVWSIAGDGGFQMTLQELVTAAEEKLPVKYALINNGHLGMVRQWQEMYFDNHLKAVPVPGPDYVKAGRGLRRWGGASLGAGGCAARAAAGQSARRPVPHRVRSRPGNQRLPHGAARRFTGRDTIEDPAIVGA